VSVSDQIEAFVVTNGRKTLDHVLRLLEAQTLPIRVTVIRDKKWIDALNEINERATCPFYLRVDDDMILHSSAAEYMIRHASKTSEKVAFYMCHLYEPSTNTVVRGIKTYRTEAAKDIGYEVDRFGKIDKIFLKKCGKKGYKIKIDDSIVGVHATSDLEDEKRYQQLWADNSRKGFNRDIVRTSFSIEEQAKMCGKFIGKMNIKNGTRFGGFIRKGK
jgi:hypothetical protein